MVPMILQSHHYDPTLPATLKYFLISPRGDVVIISLTIIRRHHHRPPNGAYMKKLKILRPLTLCHFAKHPQTSFFFPYKENFVAPIRLHNGAYDQA